MQKPSTYQRICQAAEQKNQFDAETCERLAETNRLFELTDKALTLSGMILDGYISENEFVYQFDGFIDRPALCMRVPVVLSSGQSAFRKIVVIKNNLRGNRYEYHL